MKFLTLNPAAAMKYSEPQKIVGLFFNSQTAELKAVGEDGNVRVCKTNLMEAEAVGELMKKLKAVRDEGGVICFEAAGGFSPDKWFCDIVSGNTQRVSASRSIAPHYGCVEASAWAAEMYDISGGDGENNVYLGDGMSITPDGHLVDD